MDWMTAIDLVKSKAWMPFAIFVVGYLVRLTADDSKFPVNIPHQWHAVTALVLADTLNVLTAWPDWRSAFHPAWIVALLVLTVRAYYFGKAEPAWFKWLAFIMPNPPNAATPAVVNPRDAETLTPPPVTDKDLNS